MKHDETHLTIAQLVEQFDRNLLRINRDYQSGAEWNERQQGKFVDSLFRNYPVPAIFIRVTEDEGLFGRHTSAELIDGQQRLLALSLFMSEKLRLPPPSGAGRLRLPAGVAAQPAPWLGRTWPELMTELQRQLSETPLRVFVVSPPTTDDEVRDLFIRLQAGTALTRQQIRDAWPGPVSKFVESIGGKGRHHPQSALFSMVDKRGNPHVDDDTTDLWVAHRQSCAQLFSVFVARERDPYARPGISAEDLDELYHETSHLAADVARRFREALKAGEKVFKTASDILSGRRTKWKKVHIFAAFLVVQDILRSPTIPLTDENLDLLARSMLHVDETLWEVRPKFSSAAIVSFSDRLREAFFGAAGRLDPQRDFAPELQEALWTKADGRCEICGKVVGQGDAEYDHFPIPWAVCGPTSVENGRLVHRNCHPRGRPRN